ncbi:MAG: hypothetical protein ACM3QY_09225 [Candidatus Levyibacteriota bacterium]
MTIAKARELLQAQVAFGGGYNRHGARLILDAVVREHGQAAADRLIRELALDRVFGIAPAEPPRSTS